MKKSDLKKIIKPVVRECIHEVLLEEGLLSNVVSEVTKGLQTAPLVTENVKRKPAHVAPAMRDYNEDKRKLLDAIGKDAYNGVDLFEGTTPAPAQREQRAGSVDLGDPSDAGVDISSIMGNASKMWDLMK